VAVLAGGGQARGVLLGLASSHLSASGERWAVVGAMFLALYGSVGLRGQRPLEDGGRFGRWQTVRVTVVLCPLVIAGGGVMMLAGGGMTRAGAGSLGGGAVAGPGAGIALGVVLLVLGVLVAGDYGGVGSGYILVTMRKTHVISSAQVRAIRLCRVCYGVAAVAGLAMFVSGVFSL
jgi:hypothetical protein